jgi:hypothetical protein
MGGLADVPKDVRTVNLGEFTSEHATLLAEALDAAGIVWWAKDRGFINRIWQLGVEFFVDRARVDEARVIANEILAETP